MAIDKGSGKKVRQVTKVPSWTDEAKKAYGARYGEQETRLRGQAPAWLSEKLAGLGMPSSLGSTYTPTVPRGVRDVIPAEQQRMQLQQPSIRQARGLSGSPASPDSFTGGGGLYVRGFGGQAVNLDERERRIRDMNDAVTRRQDMFDAYGPNGAADADVGNIELGNWIGDYVRSLYTVPPPMNDGGGGSGYDWWGRRRGGGGRGYSAGYNPYVPSWMTGLFQLNANR